ncbi:UTRA domain-containing protein [Corynebacterium poyangense]|uniref:UTRA domain-containing protein n=1 Tax=Corynebacterium poyangense TaxID=2684405 RepID=A0A7H0SL51_9CORY|nr:GntR family transcriptional regulator [Corynebacterium poyangense]QNQ89276.1 UTRA domain-containing protein [Corynebacterium poyangense]
MSDQQQYLIIASHLREAIQSGELQPGDKLPSEARLSQQFMSSRGTVRHALEKLRAEGLISSHQGRRSQVLLPALTQDFDSVVSFSQRCQEAGKTPGERIHSREMIDAGPRLAVQLQCSSSASVLALVRVRLMDNTPTMVERIYFPEEIASHLSDYQSSSGSMYQHLVERGVEISHAHSTVTATAADADEAQALGVAPNSPLFVVNQCVYTADGQPVWCSEQHYLPELASFSINNVKERPSPSFFTPGRA